MGTLESEQPTSLSADTDSASAAVPQQETTPGPTRAERPWKDRLRSWDVVLVSLFALAVSAFRSNRPLFGGDELVTISAATRPLGGQWGLWKFLEIYDTHQGLYYLLMHSWFAVFPVTEFAARLSSALAVGIAAAGVVVIGRQLSTRAVAVTAGIVFALLPRVTFAGTDLRVSALTMAVAAWLTVFCIAASRRGKPWWWALYGVMLLGAGFINLFLFLLVAPHAFAVRAFAERPNSLRYWALATAGAAGVMLPAFLFSSSNFNNSWIEALNTDYAKSVFQIQYFERFPAWVSLTAGLILLGGLVAALRSGVRRPGGFVGLCLVWIVVPTVVLLAISVVHPIYQPRYLTFTAPAFALLLGLCIVAVARRKVVIAVLLTAFAIAAAPNYLAQRTHFDRGAQPYPEIARILDTRAKAGDCLLVDDIDGKSWPGIRRMFHARAETFGKLTDPGAVPNLPDFTTKPIAEWKKELAGCSVLWTITRRDSALPSYQAGVALEPGPLLVNTDSFRVPGLSGFRMVERWQYSVTQLIRSKRVGAG